MPLPELSDEQRQLVFADGDQFAEACPGAGKTRAIAARFLHLTETKPRKGTGLVSFTTAAIDEVRNRCGDQPDALLRQAQRERERDENEQPVAAGGVVETPQPDAPVERRKRRAALRAAEVGIRAGFFHGVILQRTAPPARVMPDAASREKVA